MMHWGEGRSTLNETRFSLIETPLNLFRQLACFLRRLVLFESDHKWIHVTLIGLHIGLHKNRQTDRMQRAKMCHFWHVFWLNWVIELISFNSILAEEVFQFHRSLPIAHRQNTIIKTNGTAAACSSTSWWISECNGISIDTNIASFSVHLKTENSLLDLLAKIKV